MAEFDDFNNKIISAAKWSAIIQVITKLTAPVTNMILARILAPEAFGVIAAVTMVVSFADLFTDSGFQKYLVQREFSNEADKYRNANVAFWTNFTLSLLLWGIIILFRDQLATLVGNPGLGNVLALACVQLPLTSFSSIQMALYRREFDFKTLFSAQTVAVCIPFAITIPLALMGLSYWALIIGTNVSQFSNALILTVKSKWKPRFFYRVALLKGMLSFSIWSLIEAVSIWLTTWVDAFIIGSVLNQYYLGLYKTSTIIVDSLMTLITAAIIPILFSTLSRLQNDNLRFNVMFLKFHRLVSILVLPLGIGAYLYSDLAAKVLLGAQWHEAGAVIGVWALTSSLMIIFGHFFSEVYRAKGRPKLSFLAQILHLLILIPTCIIASTHGFWTLVYARSWIRIQFILVHFLILKLAIGMPVLKIIRNVFSIAVSAALMGMFGYCIKQVNDGIIWNVISIILCTLFYLGILSFFPNIRKETLGFARKVLSKNGKTDQGTKIVKPI